MTRLRQILQVIAAAAIGAALTLWATGGSMLIGTTTSPDGNERLEYYSPPRWQRSYLHRGIIPVFARLTSLTAGETVSESGVFDIGGGSADVIWRPDLIQIGTVAIYRRSTKRWEIDQ